MSVIVEPYAMPCLSLIFKDMLFKATPIAPPIYSTNTRWIIGNCIINLYKKNYIQHVDKTASEIVTYEIGIFLGKFLENYMNILIYKFYNNFLYLNFKYYNNR